jgi:hypothetical protein
MSSGSALARRIAPESTDALEVFESAAWGEAVRSDRLGLVEQVATVCAEQFGLRPLSLAPRSAAVGSSPLSTGRGTNPGSVSEQDAVVLDFARQFSVDVASVTPGQRAAFAGQLGKEAGNLTPVNLRDGLRPPYPGGSGCPLGCDG